MRILIIGVGRLKSGPERELYDDYADRFTAIGRQIGNLSLDVVEKPESRRQSEQERKQDEAAEITGLLQDGDHIIALDERGADFTSRGLADLIEHLRDQGIRRLVFIIGGPDGLDETVRKIAAQTFRFGKMTWPHRLVRVMLAEQLYRASTILAHHPYHRD